MTGIYNTITDTTTGQVFTGQLSGGIPAPTITQEKCEAQGGHCFVRTDTVLASNPPQYPERCKHCGKRRIGVPQESMRYYVPSA